MYASAGESSFEVKTEADSNDITQHPRDDKPSTFEVKIEIKTEADLTDDKPRPYLCTVCDKRFTRKENLTKHRELHTGVMYICSQCEKVFSYRSGLCKHMSIHTSKHECSVCGKRFATSCDLGVHRRSHSGEKLFECTVCSKRFSRSDSLVVHSRIHSGEKPYKCSLCNNSFTQLGHLQLHERRAHSNSRSCECPFCGKLFKTNMNLKQHVRIHTDAKLQSRTHVDTVLVVLHGLINSRDIC